MYKLLEYGVHWELKGYALSQARENTLKIHLVEAIISKLKVRKENEVRTM